MALTEVVRGPASEAEVGVLTQLIRILLQTRDHQPPQRNDRINSSNDKICSPVGQVGRLHHHNSIHPTTIHHTIATRVEAHLETEQEKISATTAVKVSVAVAEIGIQYETIIPTVAPPAIEAPAPKSAITVLRFHHHNLRNEIPTTMIVNHHHDATRVVSETSVPELAVLKHYLLRLKLLFAVVVVVAR